MVNLIKYEFIRKWRSLGVFLAIALVLNIFVLYQLRTGVNKPVDQMAALSIFFGGMLAAFFILFIVDVTIMYSQDLHQKSGYMFLLTPNSGYKLLGAKVMTGILEGFLFLLVFLALLAVNFLGIYGEPFTQFIGSDFYAMITGHLQAEGINLWSVLALVLLEAFVSVVVLVLTIYAAISIRRSILAEKKFGGFLSLLVFLLLGWLIGKITEFIFYMFFKFGILVESSINYSNHVLYLLIQIVLGIGLFLLSAFLLDKRMDI